MRKIVKIMEIQSLVDYVVYYGVSTLLMENYKEQNKHGFIRWERETLRTL